MSTWSRSIFEHMKGVLNTKGILENTRQSNWLIKLSTMLFAILERSQMMKPQMMKLKARHLMSPMLVCFLSINRHRWGCSDLIWRWIICCKLIEDEIEYDEDKKGKGCKNDVLENQFDIGRYRDTIQNGTVQHAHDIKNIRSFGFKSFVSNSSKKVFNGFDDKRYILDDGIDSLPHGHKSLRNWYLVLATLFLIFWVGYTFTKNNRNYFSPRLYHIFIYRNFCSNILQQCVRCIRRFQPWLSEWSLFPFILPLFQHQPQKPQEPKQPRMNLGHRIFGMWNWVYEFWSELEARITLPHHTEKLWYWSSGSKWLVKRSSETKVQGPNDGYKEVCIQNF